MTFARNGRYACRDGYDEPRIHVLSPKGTDRVVLWDQGGGDTTKSFPAISPDGHHLAYVDNGFLARRNVDSDIPERLRGSIEIVVPPAWSPDGKLIAFAKTCGGDPNAQLDPSNPSCGLWIARSDATRARRILEWGKNPAWSPEGRRLVFDGFSRGTSNGPSTRSAPTEPTWYVSHGLGLPLACMTSSGSSGARASGRTLACASVRAA